MNCSQIQYDLAVRADATLSDKDTSGLTVHLESCPTCRATASEFAELDSTLRSMKQPDAPAHLNARIKAAVAHERAAMRHSWLPFTSEIRAWLTHSVMPYGVGVLASIIVAVGLLAVLSSSGGQYSQFRSPEQGAFLLAQDRDPWADPTVDGVSPVAFARSRSDVASESPSINPKGALIALSRSLVRGSMKDEEVVVVADVFSDGLAQIAEVVEPSSDRHVVAELEKAFDPARSVAPFVPASLEDRPKSMRVVLRFQTVDVRMGPAKAKARKTRS